MYKNRQTEENSDQKNYSNGHMSERRSELSFLQRSQNGLVGLMNKSIEYAKDEALKSQVNELLKMQQMGSKSNRRRTDFPTGTGDNSTRVASVGNRSQGEKHEETKFPPLGGSRKPIMAPAFTGKLNNKDKMRVF